MALLALAGCGKDPPNAHLRLREKMAGLELPRPVDLWLKPYERPGDTAGAMAEYLSWETDLLTRIARDGTCNFMRV